jgi:ABC-type oligopeptide transport system ATPase subunit
MARLSTGQAFGDTSRVSAARLLGGIPVEGSGEALAQGSINAPSLQPRATPVDTFQRVGAPTLGGAPKFFAPPDLPNPGQDLANLSRALGGFSSTLQSFGETWLANKKEEGKREEAATGALAGQASRFGPARSIADLAANLEKAAALGNPDAARMLQVVREKQNSSVGKYWLGRSIEQNAIQGAALSLADRLASASVIKGADGKDIELNTLPSDDPRYLQYRDELLFGGVQMSPQGYAKNQGIIVQAQLQADQAQRKRFNANQSMEVTRQISFNQQASAQEYAANLATGMPNGQAVLVTINKLQSDVDRIKLLPLSQEQQADQLDKYAERWAMQALTALRQRGAVEINIRAMLEPLRWVMTGPVDQRVKADGKTANESLRLINASGGEVYFDQLVSKLTASQIQDNTQRAQMAGIQEQQSYNLRREAAMKDGTLKDPGASKAWYQREMESAAQIPDYQARTARVSAIEADQKDNETTYVKPVQDAKALYYAQQLAGTYNDEGKRNRLAAELQADLNANRISNTTAISIQTTLSAQGSKEVRTYEKEIEKRVNAVVKDFEANMVSPNSYGGQTITDFEYQSAFNARALARRRFTDATYKALAEGKDPTEAMNKIQANNNFGLRLREDVPGVQPPRYTDTTDLIKKNTGNWARSTIAPREANELRAQAKVRPLMELEAWDRDVTSFLNGNPSQNFKTLLKTLTMGAGGQKPSEVILNQFKLLGIEVPENELQKIRALDGQEISRAPAPRRTAPQQNQALTGVQIAGRALGNLLVAPAQASPAADMSMFYADPGAKPRPKPAAPKVTVTPQARVDGYMKRLAYIETRIRNIPNDKGSAGRGYFQAFPDFSKEAIAASGGIDPRDSNYGRAKQASAAWIRVYNKKAWAAIQAGRYDEADRLLRNTWPSLPGGSQAQDDKVQKAARKYLR